MEVCGCDKEYLSCISYTNCSDKDGCCNPYTKAVEASTEDEEDIERENAEENDLEDERMM